MPVTFPAHQGLIAPLKLRWPRAIDATALCIAAATPDLAYPLGPWLNLQSHTLLGVVVWAVPVALVAARLVRWRAAAGIFAFLPRLGPLRLRSYRVLGTRRPPLLVSVISAFVGAASHVFIDGFTHAGQWGANWIGLNDVVFSAPLRGDMTAARLLQYSGHLLGSVSFAVLLLVVASSGRLESWYGRAAVIDADAVAPKRSDAVWFWLLALTAPAALAIGSFGQGHPPELFLTITVATASLLLAGTVVSPPLLSTTRDRPSRTLPA